MLVRLILFGEHDLNVMNVKILIFVNSAMIRNSKNQILIVLNINSSHMSWQQREQGWLHTQIGSAMGVL
jgi:hypothetical protein